MDFYPIDLPVPAESRTERILLRPLTVGHVDLDYDAVMESRKELRAWSQTTWPSDEFTLAENRADLERHQREHGERVAFTYTVLTPTENRCLGCVYITPVPDAIAHDYPDADYAANVGFWVRTSERDTGLEYHLLATLRRWFAAEWSFKRVIYSISQTGTQQGDLLNSAGLTHLADFALADGRLRRAYGES